MSKKKIIFGKRSANKNFKFMISQDRNTQAGAANEIRDDCEGKDGNLVKLGVDKVDEKSAQH